MIRITAALTCAAVAVGLGAVYTKRHRRSPPHRYVAAASWLRAAIVCCVFYMVSSLTGVLDEVVCQPIAVGEQLANPLWWMWAGGLVVFILVAYWVVWARYTLRFERALDPVPQTIFGLMWGTAFGLFFLSVWHLVEDVASGLTTWQVFLLTYLLVAFWQALFMDLFWDVYVTPEHDSPCSIRLKVPITHVPNLTASLAFFALYRNHAIFVILQTLALIGASISMRMPAPGSTAPTPVPRREPSIFFGLPRAAGYLSPDPTRDPYLRDAHLPC